MGNISPFNEQSSTVFIYKKFGINYNAQSKCMRLLIKFLLSVDKVLVIFD